MGNGLATYYKTETRSNAYNTTDRLRTGREFHAYDGLSWHDNAARFNDTIFPRFTTVDPLAEQDPGTSPYAYCGNNPLRFIDQSGMYLLVTGNVKEKAVNQLQSDVGGSPRSVDLVAPEWVLDIYFNQKYIYLDKNDVVQSKQKQYIKFYKNFCKKRKANLK